MFLDQPQFEGDFAEPVPDFGGGLTGRFHSYVDRLKKQDEQWMEVISSAYGAGVYVDNFTAEQDAHEEVYKQHIETVRNLTGVELETPFGVGEKYFTSGYEPPRDAQGRKMTIGEVTQLKMDKFDGELTKLARMYPEHAKAITNDGKSFEQSKLDLVASKQQNFDKVLTDSSLAGADKTIASVVGYLGAATQDPLQVATSFLGGGAATGRTVVAKIAKVAATQAAINGAIEIPLQIKTQDLRKRAGLEHGFKEGLKNVGIAALMGAGIGGATQAGGEIFTALSRAKEAKKITPEGEAAIGRALNDELLPEDADVLEDQLAKFLERELTIDESQMIKSGFERDALDNDFLDNAGSSFDLPADADDVRVPLAEAALRYADDPDNHLPPEFIEREMANAEGVIRSFTAEDYIRQYDLVDVDDPIAAVIDHGNARHGATRPVDEVVETLAPPDFIPVKPKSIVPDGDDVAKQSQGDVIDYGDLDPELRTSLEQAQSLVPDIEDLDPKHVENTITIFDDEGNPRVVTAKAALDEANVGVMKADILEACAI